MPRGYQKRYSASVGRKRGRGGSSKNGMRYESYFWDRIDFSGSIGRRERRKGKRQPYPYSDVDWLCPTHTLWDIVDDDLYEEEYWYLYYLHRDGHCCDYVDEGYYCQYCCDGVVFCDSQCSVDGNFVDSTCGNTANYRSEEAHHATQTECIDDSSSKESFSLVDAVDDAESFSLCSMGRNVLSDFIQVETGSFRSNESDEKESEYGDISFHPIDKRSLESDPDVATSACQCIPATTSTTILTSSCAICMEEKPLFGLIKHCRKSHPSACRECLRTLYIDNGIRTNNPTFPLRCFWPGCDRVLRNVQVQKLANTWAEIDRFYLKVAEFKALYHRPLYHLPQNVGHGCPRLKGKAYNAYKKEEKRILKLKRDIYIRLVDTMGNNRDTLDCLTAVMKEDNEDGIGICPMCTTPFIKVGGCYNIRCPVCDHSFNAREEELVPREWFELDLRRKRRNRIAMEK